MNVLVCVKRVPETGATIILTEDQQEIVVVTASRIEADFVETASGQYKLWSFLAKDGISFKDENSHLDGDKLFYNDTTSVLTVNGNESYPAYYKPSFTKEERELIREETAGALEQISALVDNLE